MNRDEKMLLCRTNVNGLLLPVLVVGVAAWALLCVACGDGDGPAAHLPSGTDAGTVADAGMTDGADFDSRDVDDPDLVDAEKDDTCTGAWWPDGDRDGYGDTFADPVCVGGDGFVGNGYDCDDSKAEVGPGAPTIRTRSFWI